MFYPTSFEIDSLENLKFDGFTDGSLWNGFSTPLFDHEVTRSILVEMYHAKTIEGWKFSIELDTFYVRQHDSFEDEIYQAQTIRVQGKRLKVYGLGSSMWVWSEAESPAKNSLPIYTVLSGMHGGYLPDSVSYFADKKLAESYMLDLKAESLDSGYKVSGSVKSGYYEVSDPEASERSLGSYIELNDTRLGDLGLSASELTDPLDILLERLNNA